jgi:hypothetical protein
MKERSQEEPNSDSSIDSLEESRARLRSMQQLVCHLLSRNQQLRMELSDSNKASSSDGRKKKSRDCMCWTLFHVGPTRPRTARIYQI